MRQFRVLVAAGILGGLVAANAPADEILKSPLGPTGIKKILTPTDDCPDGSCGKFGTTVSFVSTPAAAAKQAAKEQKLVLVLHVSGNFENPDFTWNNAEALRVNALNNPQVGEYLNKYFVTSFQKVGTFKIVGKQKQGGNVATYFCAPDGRVLNVVAGPVNAQTMLKESQWVVDHAYKAIKESNGDGAKFKAYFRKAHADKLRNENGIVVEPITYDPPVKIDPDSALTYRDPTGKALAPILSPAPIHGPDVKLNYLQAAEAKADGAKAMKCGIGGFGGQVVLGTVGQGHQLMTAHCMRKIEDIYGAVFTGILGEQISTQPVIVVNPFPWHKGGK